MPICSFPLRTISSLALSCSSRSLISVVPPAGFNRPEGRDQAVTNSNAVAMQVHCGAAMGWDHFHTVTHAERGVHGFDDGVLLGKFEDPVAGAILDDRRAEITGYGFTAGIENVPVRAPADHGGGNRQSTAELRTDRMIGTIHEDE